MRSQAVPRLARWLVAISCPPDTRASLLGDLQEGFEQVSRARDPRAAVMWYWREAVSALVRLPVTRRLGRQRSTPRPGRRGSLGHLPGSVRDDARHAVRVFARSPTLTAITVMTIAFAIGTSTAIFSVVKGLLLDPLPYPAAERLVMVWSRFEQLSEGRGRISGPALAALRQHEGSFERVGAMWTRFGSLTDNDDPEQIDIGWVSHGYLDALGVQPLLGRTFAPEEDVPNAPPVLVLSYGAWMRRYGGDPDLVGRTVQFNGEPVTVIGVMPPGFHLVFPEDARLPDDVGAWLPWGGGYAEMDPNWHLFSVVARLAPGAEVRQLDRELDVVARELRDRHREYAESGLTFDVVPLHADVVAPVRAGLAALGGGALVVLLIGAVNVTTLLLVHSLARLPELRVRMTLGAPAGRVARQVVTEIMVLFAMGGLGGWAVAATGLNVIRTITPARVPRIENVQLDAAALAFGAVSVLLVGLAVGLVIAHRATKVEIAEVQTGAGRMSESRARRRLSSALVVAQMAAAVILMVCAGLLVRTYAALQRVERGFTTDHVLTVRVSLPNSRYRYTDPVRIGKFYTRLVDNVATLSGVTALGVTDLLPLGSTSTNQTPYAFGTEQGEAAWGAVTADYRVITPDFFRATGTRLLAGRFFDQRDVLDAPIVTIVDEQLAQRVWPDRDPVGERIKVDVFLNERSSRVWAEVVGVVQHVRNTSLRSAGRDQVYLSMLQSPRRSMTLAVRHRGPAAALVEQIERQVRALDPLLPIFDVRTFDAYLRDAVAPTRFLLSLLGAFAGLAIALATVGIYGVIAATVKQRGHEISIRKAVGAANPVIFRDVLGGGMRLAAAGVLLGMAAAGAVVGLLSDLVFGIEVLDESTFVTVAAIATGVAALACLVPARRAAKVSPLQAMHDL